MQLFIDYIKLSAQCVFRYAADTPGGFSLTLAIAIVSGAICWAVCSKWTYLWNRRYQANAFHHLMCGIAAAMTILSIVTLVSLKKMRDIAIEAIDSWEEILRVPDQGNAADPESVAIYSEWSNDTFQEAYWAVRNSSTVSPNEWANYPPPPQGQNIPFGPTVSPGDQTPIELSAQTYADMAVELFADQHPSLNAVLWADTQLSESDIVTDINQYLADERARIGQQGNVTYPLERATLIAVKVIRGGLDERVPRVVFLTRTVLIVLSLVMFLAPFLAVGWAAYNDLKSHRRRR